MKKLKKLVNIDDVKAGMELASNITNRFGQVILFSGAVLEEKHISLFKTWGIEMLSVYDSEQGDELFGSLPLSLEKQIIKDDIIRLLTWQPTNAYEKDLISMAIEGRAERSQSRKT